MTIDGTVAAAWLQESYVSMDKSPIDRMHVQIIPIEHFPSTMMLPESTHHEMERYFG